jgi:hypothetical protein
MYQQRMLTLPLLFTHGKVETLTVPGQQTGQRTRMMAKDEATCETYSPGQPMYRKIAK